MVLERQDAYPLSLSVPYNLYSVLETHLSEFWSFRWHLTCDDSAIEKQVEVDMEKAKTTTDHEHIKQFVEERGGHPARVKGTAVGGSSGVLLIDYPGYLGTQTLEVISWDEFFKGFEENELAFLYEDEKQAGSQSRFSKLINRDPAQQWSRAA
jgi:hypothetical protein